MHLNTATSTSATTGQQQRGRTATSERSVQSFFLLTFSTNTDTLTWEWTGSHTTQLHHHQLPTLTPSDGDPTSPTDDDDDTTWPCHYQHVTPTSPSWDDDIDIYDNNWSLTHHIITSPHQHTPLRALARRVCTYSFLYLHDVQGSRRFWSRALGLFYTFLVSYSDNIQCEHLPVLTVGFFILLIK